MGLEPIIHDVIDGHTEWLEVLIELFTASFPQYAHTAPRLRQKAVLPPNANPNLIAHQWLAEIDSTAVGLLSFKYAPARNLGLALYLAIKLAYRTRLVNGQRLSEWLFKSAMEKLTQEARAMRQPTPSGLFMEVESEKLVARYRQFGFVELPVEYYEPRFCRARNGIGASVGEEQIEWTRMHLGGLPIGGFDPADPAMLTNVVLAFMVDHYGLPQNHWAVQRALESIR